MEENIYGYRHIDFDTTRKSGQLFEMLKVNREKIPKEKFVGLLKGLHSSLAESTKDALEIANAQTDMFAKKTMVLCVTEMKENLLIWSHYSAAHTEWYSNSNVLMK